MNTPRKESLLVTFAKTFFVKFFYFVIAAAIFMIIGIWSRVCLIIGLCLLLLDFIWSIVELVMDDSSNA